MLQSSKDIPTESKKGEKRPATGNISLLINRDSKRKMAEQNDGQPLVRDQVDKAITSIVARVGDCVTAYSETVGTLNQHSDHIQENTDDINCLKKQNRMLEKRLNEMGAVMKGAINRITKAECVGVQNSQALKGFNLVIEGVKEKQDENCIKTVMTIFKTIDNKYSSD